MLSYTAAYENTQTCSPYFRQYLSKLVNSLVRKYDLRDKVVIEVGCGKGGHFLRQLCKDGRNRGIGFDPTYVGPETLEGGAVQFVRGFLRFTTDAIRSRFCLLPSCQRRVLSSTVRTKWDASRWAASTVASPASGFHHQR